jgi:anhydro-N-acetylmuramic acid kinase
MEPVTAIGLMSGTSYDGVDVALIDTDGEAIGRVGPTGPRAYAVAERALIRRALAAAANLNDRADRSGCIAEAEALVTTAHAEAVEAFMAANGMPANEIGVVGFHGQTVLHAPERGLTVQLGDGRALAQRLGIPVVYDFRAADVAAGGERAPPVGVVNLGGVANVTFIDGDDIVAFDTGPSNALIDDFVRQRTGAPYDADGKLAAAGRVDEAALARMLLHPFFARRPPKSLDRDAFRAFLTDAGDLAGKSTEDGAATLTALTAASLAQAAAFLPRAPKSWIVGGGGARNSTMMRMLADRLAPARLESADAIGWSSDALEAQAFAYLAVRSLRGLPLTFPTTTGVPRPLTGGVVARP